MAVAPILHNRIDLFCSRVGVEGGLQIPLKSARAQILFRVEGAFRGPKSCSRRLSWTASPWS
jgi:hypothetical protein